MKQIRFNRGFQIAYPLVLYFLVYQVGAGFWVEFFGTKRLVGMIISGVICIIPLWLYYSRVPKLVTKQHITSNLLIKYFICLVFIVLVGVITNIILTNSGIIDQSQNFDQARTTLSDGSTLIKIICSVIVIPILEELLIRGIICGQLASWYNPVVAVLISSIFFGILHNNIVQFIYALVMGIAIGFVYINTRRLTICILGHSIINLIVILFT